MRYVVINRKTTKFESNSQLGGPALVRWVRCYQSQNYKIWKQFTTQNILTIGKRLLLSITKLQNLKAIHNPIPITTSNGLVVINRKTTKFESNSQQSSVIDKLYEVVINHKTTKFESNSQRNNEMLLFVNGCYQSQNYKIWKQFTT